MKFISISIFVIVAFIFMPMNIMADWEQPETATVGPITSIASLNNNLYAGSSSNGVYLSVNNGFQWIERNTGITNLDVQSMVVCGDGVYAGTNGAGVFKTTNLGEKWVAKNDGLGNFYVYSLAVEGDSIYAVTDNSGVFMSTDKGETWFSLNNGDIIGIVLYTINVKNGTVYVGGQYGDIYTTSDHGLTWNNIKSGDLFFDVKSIAFKDNMILAGTSSGVVLSKDNGSTWKLINNGLKNTNIMHVDFNGNFLYAATKGGGVFISDNDGVSWIAINEGIPDMNVLTLSFTSEYVFAGTQYNSVSRRKLSEISVPEVEPPLLVTPENGNPSVNPKVTFTWQESVGAESYFIQVALSDNFGNPIFQEDDVKTTTITQDLEKGLLYYWRVAANTANGERKWSEVWSFRIREDQTHPVLIAPADKSKDIAIPVNFIWTKSKGTAYYNIQISKDETFEELIVNKQIENDTTFSYDKLDVETKYYWRIYSVGYDNNKLESSIFTFTTGVTSVYEYLTQSNNELSLYPNPAGDNLTLKINFETNNADVSLISVEGIVLANVYSGNLSKGFSITLNEYIKALPASVYYIRITSPKKNLIIPFVKN
jgi:photosystem II stability/assembly factor-like uncharacterized protein